MLKTHKLIISFALCLPVFAGVSPIGIATSDGDIEIGRVRMPGPATLYEGSVIESGTSPVRVSLRNGAVVRLGSSAKATVNANWLLLESGIGQMDVPADYMIRARAVTLTPTSQPARARVELSSDGVLQVAAISGSFAVRRAGLLSTISAGKSLQFAAPASEAGATAPSEFKGCLAKSETNYLLHDELSKTVIALEGSDITAKTGDRVTVVGKPDSNATPVSGANQVVHVLRLTVDGHGCSTKLAAATAGTAGAAGNAGPSGAATGGLSATTITVIGVAAASAALIPTIALTSGSSSSISPSSR